MSLLAAKILLAPTFVMVATLAARRYGTRIGGLLGGLPVVAGPILLVFTLTHGPAFAAGAASGTLLGIVSLGAFIVLYTRLAGRYGWKACLPAGWGAFLAVSGVLSFASVAPWQALCVALAALAATLLGLPSPQVTSNNAMGEPPPRWDLALRGVSALALVLALTTLAGQLGPKLSGLLTPFPVVATVLASFTHAQYGTDDLARIMRGFVVGLVAYTLFCFTLAVSLRPLGTATSFGLAVAAALAAQAIVLTVAVRRPQPATREPIAREPAVESL